MTEYKLNRFTMADAQALAGKTADITAWDDDELETKVTYPGARVTGIIVLIGPYLVIKTAGAVITDTPDRERLSTRPPVPELHSDSPGSASGGVRDRFERGDRVALEHTDDPHTRLRPGDEGTVTRYDPEPGQLDVRWDSGSTLSMLLNDGDRVRLVTPAPGTGRPGRSRAGERLFPAARSPGGRAAPGRGPRPPARPGRGVLADRRQQQPAGSSTRSCCAASPAPTPRSRACTRYPT